MSVTIGKGIHLEKRVGVKGSLDGMYKGSLEGVTKNYVACNSYRRKCSVVEFAETDLAKMANPRFIYGGEEAYSEAVSHILAVTESATVKERVLRPLSKGVLVKLVLSKESPLYGEQPFCEDHFNVRRAVCFASLMVSGKSGLDFATILASEVRSLDGGLLIDLKGKKATVETTLDAFNTFAQISRDLIKQLGANAVYLTNGVSGNGKDGTPLSDVINTICGYIDFLDSKSGGDASLVIGGSTNSQAIGPYCRAFIDYCTTSLSPKYIFAGTFDKEDLALTLATNTEVNLPKFITDTNVLTTAESLILGQKGEAIVEACAQVNITNDQIVGHEKDSLGISLRDDAFRNMYKAFYSREVRSAQTEYQRVERLFKKHKDQLRAASLVYWFMHVNDNEPISDTWSFLFRVLNREASDSLQSMSSTYVLTRSYIDEFLKDTKTRSEMDEVAAMVKSAVEEYYEVWTLRPDGAAFRGCTFMEHTAGGATYYPTALLQEYKDEPLYFVSAMPTAAAKLVSGGRDFNPTALATLDMEAKFERFESENLQRYIPPVSAESAIIPWLDRDPFKLECRSQSADRFVLIGDTSDLDDYINQLSHFVVEVSQTSVVCTSLQSVYCIRQSSGIGGGFKYLGKPSGKQYGTKCTLDFVEKKNLTDCDKLLVTSLDNHKVVSGAGDGKDEDDYSDFVERRFAALRRVKIAEQPRLAPRIKQLNETRSDRLSQTRYEPTYATKNAVQSELLKVACSPAVAAGGYIAGRRVAYRATVKPVFVTGIKKQDLADSLCDRLAKKGLYYTPFRAGGFVDALFVDMTNNAELEEKYGEVVFIGFLSLVGNSTSNCTVKGDYVKSEAPNDWKKGIAGRKVEILSGIAKVDQHTMYDKYIYTTQQVNGLLSDGRPCDQFLPYTHFISSDCMPSAALSTSAVARAADAWMAMAAGVATDYALGAFLVLLGQCSKRKDSSSSAVRTFNPIRALVRVASFIDYFYSMFGLHIVYPDGSEAEAKQGEASSGADNLAAETSATKKTEKKGKKGHTGLSVLGPDGVEVEEAVQMVDFFLGYGSSSFSLLKFQSLLLQMLTACVESAASDEVNDVINSFVANDKRTVKATEARPIRCGGAAPSVFAEKMETFTLLADAVDVCDCDISSFYSLDHSAMRKAIGLCILNKDKPEVDECKDAVRKVVEAIDSRAHAAWYGIEDRYKPISCTPLGSYFLPSLYGKLAGMVSTESQVTAVEVERFAIDYAKDGPASYIARLLLLEARTAARNWHLYNNVDKHTSFMELCKDVTSADGLGYSQVRDVIKAMLTLIGISEADISAQK